MPTLAPHAQNSPIKKEREFDSPTVNGVNGTVPGPGR
jgi:hypothetical protein